jgi:hypothetical protein
MWIPFVTSIQGWLKPESGRRTLFFGQKKKGSRRERSAQFLGRWLLTTYFIALTRTPKRDL